MPRSHRGHLTRRAFLRTLALGAGASVLAACAPAAAPSPTSAPSKPADATKPADASKPAAQPAATAAPAAKAVAKVDQLTVVINASPWMGGFKAMADEYTKRSGVKMQLAAFPFDEVFPKERNAAVNKTNEFDLFTLGESWVAFFFAGGFVRPIKELAPDFKFDDAVIQYNNLARWNAEKRYFTNDGELLGVPQAGIHQLLFYRGDKYKEAGLQPPTTWDDVENAAKALHKPDQPFFGYVNRGAKGDAIAWDWLAHFEGRTQGETGLFKSPPDDWTPTFNNDIGLQALERYIQLAKYAPPNVGDINQADQINLMGGDKALQTVAAASARSAMDDDKQSAVPGKVDFAVVPKPANGRHAAMSGSFVLAIPKHLPQERQEAGWEFMQWAMTLDAQVEFLKGGGVPVRTDAYTSSVASEPKFRFSKAMAESAQYTHPFFRIPEGPQIRDQLGLRLNQALVGQMQPKEALATAEQEIVKILKEANYKVG